MKKLVFIAIAAIAFTTATQAQDSTGHKKTKTPEHMGYGQVWDNLNLTQDQKDKMQKLRDENDAKIKEIKNNSSLNDAEKNRQTKALREEHRKNVEALLTDEQKAKMRELRKDRMKEHKGMKTSSDSTMHRR